MFEFNEAEGRWDPLHHPFTAPAGELDPERPGDATALAYDVVWNGQELGGGSIRISDPEVQKRALEVIGIDAAEAEERFGFLLEALRYGAPPHGGIAYGLDRIVQRLERADSIRDVIAFPKAASGADPLTGRARPGGRGPAARARPRPAGQAPGLSGPSGAGASVGARCRGSAGFITGDERGGERALGGVLLGVAILVILYRRSIYEPWGDFAIFAVLLAPTAFLLGLGVLGGRAGGGLPTRWQTAYAVFGLVLLPLTLYAFLNLVGGDAELELEHDLDLRPGGDGLVRRGALGRGPLRVPVGSARAAGRSGSRSGTRWSVDARLRRGHDPRAAPGRRAAARRPCGAACHARAARGRRERRGRGGRDRGDRRRRPRNRGLSVGDRPGGTEPGADAGGHRDEHALGARAAARFPGRWSSTGRAR